MSDLAALDAVALRQAYLRRGLSPVEVVDAAFERVAELDPRLNALVTPTRELALHTARAAEQRYLRGEAAGPGDALLGVPVTVKDNLPTEGIRTTMGSLLFRDWVPEQDAVIVARVRAAGAVIIGKTNTCEFGWKGDAGNRVFGPTRNPWRSDTTSGGSSGGAAAGTAAGFAPIALGTDGAGSLRIPAAYCGVVGFKPSHGTVPIAPRGGVGTLSHHGPIARSVRDVAHVLGVIAGPDPRDRLSDARSDRCFTESAADLTGLRVGWSATLGYAHVEPEVLALVTGAVDVFSQAGAEVVEFEPALEDPHDVAWQIFELAQAAQHAHELDAVRDLLDPGRLALVEAGIGLDAIAAWSVHSARDAFHQAMMEVMAGFDLLVTPTMPDVAFTPGADHPAQYAGAPTGGFRWSPFTYPFNLTGQPAISLPCGLTAAGLPVGLQVVGRWRDDETVLRAAAAFEALHPWPRLAPVGAMA